MEWTMSRLMRVNITWICNISLLDRQWHVRLRVFSVNWKAKLWLNWAREWRIRPWRWKEHEHLCSHTNTMGSLETPRAIFYSACAVVFNSRRRWWCLIVGGWTCRRKLIQYWREYGDQKVVISYCEMPSCTFAYQKWKIWEVNMSKLSRFFVD